MLNRAVWVLAPGAVEGDLGVNGPCDIDTCVGKRRQVENMDNHLILPAPFIMAVLHPEREHIIAMCPGSGEAGVYYIVVGKRYFRRVPGAHVPFVIHVLPVLGIMAPGAVEGHGITCVGILVITGICHRCPVENANEHAVRIAPLVLGVLHPEREHVIPWCGGCGEPRFLCRTVREGYVFWVPSFWCPFEGRDRPILRVKAS